MGWIKYKPLTKPQQPPQQTRRRSSSLEGWMEEQFEALSDAVAYNEKMLAKGYNSRISSPAWTVYSRKLTARDKREIRKYRKFQKGLPASKR